MPYRGIAVLWSGIIGMFRHIIRPYPYRVPFLKILFGGTIYGAGMCREMNSEEGLRALESLHVRLCVLERAHANRLGVQYPNHQIARIDIFTTASFPIYKSRGNLSRPEIEALITKIVQELKDNGGVIDQNQFKIDIADRIRHVTPVPYESTQVQIAKQTQLTEVFQVAFKRAFITPGG